MVQAASFPIQQPHYSLRCPLCDSDYGADPFQLSCQVPHAPALLRAVYSTKTMTVNPRRPGVFQFSDWLPVARWFGVTGKPITYASTALAHYLGLDRLSISFNGYWPEREAYLLTGSFKELEAPTVLARIPEADPRTLVLASAGNTGRAFATLCSTLKIPLCLVLPETSLQAIWATKPFHPCVQLITVGAGGDYSDAIALANLISQMDGYVPEGGAANVARRDGMGLTVVDAALTLGHIPNHYFQAVGSGTGGVSAWEANLRLLQDGRFGRQTMTLHLAQNAPFTPMVTAWQAGYRQITPTTEAIAKAQIDHTAAKVLTNRNPAYSITNGVYDALSATGGQMYSVTNQEAGQAQELFEHLEGIDISPASGVALGALMQAVATNKVSPDDAVLLNVTSGGIRRVQQDYALHYLKSTLAFSPRDIQLDVVQRRLGGDLCKT
ncbi:MAG: cysteate synthase [Elainellaceae cyanobacterium]